VSSKHSKKSIQHPPSALMAALAHEPVAILHLPDAINPVFFLIFTFPHPML
jgi:hypothetical protein